MEGCRGREALHHFRRVQGTTSHESPAVRAAPCLHSVLRRSVQVDYYDKAPVKDGKAKDGTKAKSRGVFDLREVEALSKPTDPTAPDWCVMVQVEKHRFVLDFGYKGERNAWLRIWCNAVPSLAISKEWQAEFVDEAMKKEIAARGPFGQIGGRGSIFGSTGAIGRRLSRTLSRSNSSMKDAMKNIKTDEPDAEATAAAAATAALAPKPAGTAAAEAEAAKAAAAATTTTPPATAVAKTGSKPTPLADLDTNCGEWAGALQCDQNAAYMLSHCETSCASRASEAACAAWAAAAMCDDAGAKGFMGRFCAASCRGAAVAAKVDADVVLANADADDGSYVPSTIFSGEPSAMEEAEFEAIVKANPGVMVNFMAPWCFWSNKLTPDWLACGKRLHKRAYSQSVGFLRVDCTKSRKLCETQMVHAFPTIRTYRGTIHSYEPYEFGREENVLWLHLVKMAAETVVQV